MRHAEARQRANKEHLIGLIERNTQELHHLVDVQRNLQLSILGEIKDDFPVDLCSVVDCPHRRLLRQILTETIETLEETKKAFKSKRLEGLRKKLMDVLKEDT